MSVVEGFAGTVTGTVTGLVARAAGTDSAPTGVGPGWVAFVVVVALCVATTLLWLNMRKQLGKIRFEEQETPRRRGGRGTGLVTSKDTSPSQEPPAT